MERQSKTKEDSKNFRRRRRVQFSTAVDDIFYLRDIVPSSMMTKKEKKSVWYSYEDMDNMRADAKELALQLRKVAYKSDPSSLPVDNGRGLETLIFQGRQFKRYIAARTIMECQRKNKLNIAVVTKYRNPNTQLLAEAAALKLAYVSIKCSQWARNVALMTGYSDFEGVNTIDETRFPKSSIERLCQLRRKRKRTHETAYSVGEIETIRCNKKKITSTKNLTHSLSIPISMIRSNILLPSIC